MITSAPTKIEPVMMLRPGTGHFFHPNRLATRGPIIESRNGKTISRMIHRPDDDGEDELVAQLQELEEEEEVPVGPWDGDRAWVGRRLELKVLLHVGGQQTDRDEHHDRDDRVRPEVVWEERMRVLVGHVVCQVVTGGTHENREESQTDHDRIEDVVGPDWQTLVIRLERVTAVPVDLDQRDLLRRFGRGRSGSFLLDLFVHTFSLRWHGFAGPPPVIDLGECRRLAGGVSVGGA